MNNNLVVNLFKLFNAEKLLLEFYVQNVTFSIVLRHLKYLLVKFPRGSFRRKPTKYVVPSSTNLVAKQNPPPDNNKNACPRLVEMLNAEHAHAHFNQSTRVGICIDIVFVLIIRACVTF